MMLAEYKTRMTLLSSIGKAIGNLLSYLKHHESPVVLNRLPYRRSLWGINLCHIHINLKMTVHRNSSMVSSSLITW